MAPEMLAGRWLAEGSLAQPNALVVNSDLVDDERDLHVGSEVMLDIGGRKATWHVVGIVATESRGPAVYVSRDDYAYATRTAGEGTRCRCARPSSSDSGRTGAQWRRTAAGAVRRAGVEGQRHRDRVR